MTYLYTHIYPPFLQKKHFESENKLETRFAIKCLSAFEKLHWQVASHRKIDPKE